MFKKNSELPLAEIFDLLPWNIFPSSAKVDFFLFASKIKPAVRTKIEDLTAQDFIVPLLISLEWFPLIDETGFCIVSHDKKYSKLILKTDKSLEPHEMQLGKLLGYPDCCTKHCAAISESNIDNYAQEFARNTHKHNIELLNISDYERGISLISHIPCSYNCQPSINMAKETLRELKNQPNKGKISEWKTQVLHGLKLLN